MKKDNHKRNSLIIIAVMTTVVMVVIMSVALSMSGYTPPPKQDALPQASEEEKYPDLNLTVKPYVLTLGITSNEPTELLGCTVRINDGYEMKAALPAGKEVELNYRAFTKDAERFDTDKYSVEKIIVDRCINADGRMGIYGTNK